MSISECTASLVMAAEPVMAAATDFARATSKLPARAAQTEKTVLLFAIVSRQVSRRYALKQRLKYRTATPPWSLSEYFAWPRPRQISPQARRSRRGWANAQ